MADVFEERGPECRHTRDRTKADQKASCLFWPITTTKRKAKAHKGAKLNNNLNWEKTNAGHGKVLMITINLNTRKPRLEKYDSHKIRGENNRQPDTRQRYTGLKYTER